MIIISPKNFIYLSFLDAIRKSHNFKLFFLSCCIGNMDFIAKMNVPINLQEGCYFVVVA